MPLVTRQANQGRLFVTATEPADWLDGDLWSDTTANTLKLNVTGTATAIGQTDAEIQTLISANEIWELLDNHVATGVEADYTFTPSSDLEADTYSKIIVIIQGECSGALALEMVLNGANSTDHFSNGQRLVDGAATDINLAEADEFQIADATLLGGDTAVFFAQVQIPLLVGTSGSNGFRSTTNAGFNNASYQNMAHTQGPGVLAPINSIKIQTSTSTWKAAAVITTYGVKIA